VNSVTFHVIAFAVFRRICTCFMQTPAYPGDASSNTGGTGFAEDRARSGEGASSSGREAVWGIIVNFEKAAARKGGPGDLDSDHKDKRQTSYVVDVLVNCEDSPNGSLAGRQAPLPFSMARFGRALPRGTCCRSVMS
jgi:rRNA-processing arch domain